MFVCVSSLGCHTGHNFFIVKSPNFAHMCMHIYLFPIAVVTLWLAATFLSGTYLAKICEVDVAACCILAHMCRN